MRFRLAIAAASLLAAGLLVATISAVPVSQFKVEPETAPSEVPTIVLGTVYDSGGLPEIGAEVNVSMYDGETLRSYQIDISDSLGGYQASFGFGMGGDEWGVGDTIRVVAENGEYTGTNSTLAIDGPFQYVNVTLSTVIPEFGDLGTLVPIAGLMGMFVAFFFVHRKRES